MKKDKNQLTGIQILCGCFDLKESMANDPTKAFLGIVCCGMTRDQLKDYCGFSDWEYDRIFCDDPETNSRWYRSLKMAFQTMDAHMNKQNLDDCQYYISFLLWSWIRDEYLNELGDEMENVVGESVIDSLDNELGFEADKTDLNIVGELMLVHFVDTHDLKKTVNN